MSDKERSRIYVTASELGEYLYCHRQWWLKQEYGVESQHEERLTEGVAYHEQHGRLVVKARRYRFWGYILMTVAGTMLLLSFLSMIS